MSQDDNLVVSDSGLVINPQWPYIGASPDGIVECTCHGKRVLEIKCPYSHRGETVLSATLNDTNLKRDDDGALHLDPGHAYYYQVQTQMLVCGVECCDFCVCTFPKEEGSLPHSECIKRNEEFWETCLLKASNFFRSCLLPELLGNWYTRPIITSSSVPDDSMDCIAASTSESVGQLQPDCSTATASQDSELYCYCRGLEAGSMIACDNNECKIEWYHMSCLLMTSIPKGKWYCPDYRLLPQFQRKKKSM